MKNSPHRFKHLRKKAARQINLTDVKLKTKTEKLNSRRKITGVILEQIRPFEDHLKPISEKKAKEMLDYFVKHWQRESKIKKGSFHRSKRTTPGEVEAGAPYTKIIHTADKIMKQKKSRILLKSNKIAKKMLKHQNQQYKKAA